ncbi:hypothetical protein JCM11491_000731 [Sporobolomyces phaffii]
MSNSRPRVPPPPSSVSRVEPSSLAGLPATVTQLKYVCFSWPNNPTTKRDPIAQAYFKAHVQMSTFTASLGGFPLVLFEGALGRDKPIELFLGDGQCRTLLDGLADKMGPTRARATWKKDAVHDLARVEGLTAWRFPDQEALEARFGQLKDLNDFYETATRHEALVRSREVVGRILAEPRLEARFVSVDIETWERDHDLVTEVGFAKSTWRNGKFESIETRHFVVQENSRLRNGRYCPDARDHFHFGTTETLPAESLLKLLREQLVTPSAPVFLLLHDARSDLKSLQLLGLSTSHFTHASPLPSPDHERGYTDPDGGGNYLIDTQVLSSGFNRKKKQARLGDAVTHLGISFGDRSSPKFGGGLENDSRTSAGQLRPDELKFHNAGNDALATLLLFWKLMEPDGE